MKLSTLVTYLPPLLEVEISELTETLRGLKEGSSHFDEAGVGYQESVAREAHRVASSFQRGEMPATFLLGRPGPGGGVEADPFRVAFFILALMSGEPRKQVAERTWDLWHLETAGSKTSGYSGDSLDLVRCSKTGEFLLGEALRRILESSELARQVKFVCVGSDDKVKIVFSDDIVSIFGSIAVKKRYVSKRILDGSVFSTVADLLNREH